MKNYEIIECLAKTSSFNVNQYNFFLNELLRNLDIDSNNCDHLIIRSKIANLNNFVDAELVNNFGS